MNRIILFQNRPVSAEIRKTRPRIQDKKRLLVFHHYAACFVDSRNPASSTQNMYRHCHSSSRSPQLPLFGEKRKIMSYQVFLFLDRISLHIPYAALHWASTIRWSRSSCRRWFPSHQQTCRNRVPARNNSCSRQRFEPDIRHHIQRFP